MQYYLEQIKIKLGGEVAKILSIKDSAQVELANPEIDADLAVPCFNLAKYLNMKPNEVATKLAEQLSDSEVSKVEADSGYLNMWLNPKSIAEGVSRDFAAITNEHTENWYDYLSGLISKFMNANAKFVNGDIADKQGILLAIGQNPVLIDVDGKLQITPFPFLERLAEAYPELEAEYIKVPTLPKQRQKDAFERLRLSWLHKAGATQTQRKELVNDLLNRYSSLESCLHLFRNFSFVAREPKVALVL